MQIQKGNIEHDSYTTLLKGFVMLDPNANPSSVVRPPMDANNL